MIILIPAYQPGDELVDLVRSIRTESPKQAIVVVDDGSGPGFESIFDAARRAEAEVVGLPTNLGKGAALRRGFAHIAAVHPGHDVVCADCDGQHRLTDILRVAAALEVHPEGPVLGARQFVGDVPARSRFGNTVTRHAFDLATGRRLHDTQTGLRGYPASMLAWLQAIRGDRFEYELDVLLHAHSEGFDMHEVPIETVYLAGNESSHFRTIRDSVRVYVPLVRFGLSSLASFALDAIVLFALFALTGNLALSVITARLTSASFNFAANHHLVFARSGRSKKQTAWRYGLLAAALLGANYTLLRALTGSGLGIAPAKLLTDALLFAVSYQLQRRVVFANSQRAPRSHAGPTGMLRPSDGNPAGGVQPYAVSERP